MAVSQNGWPVNPVRSARIVPGTNVKLTVAAGAAGDVLMYVAEQFDKRVEDLDPTADDWGYANRAIRGSTAISNHASATAIDLNATKHPLGKAGTFTAGDVRVIHQILGEVDNVVRWGGDYSGRVDEMHFEINAPESKVKRVADKLKGGGMAIGFEGTFEDLYGNRDASILNTYRWNEKRIDDTNKLVAKIASDVSYSHKTQLDAITELKTAVVLLAGQLADIETRLEAK